MQHVLDRAKVGRSTFYSHFVGKEDLFLSDVEDFFQMMAAHLSRNKEASTRLAPVREMFAHVAQAHEFMAALVVSGRIHEILQLAQGHFASELNSASLKFPSLKESPPATRTVLGIARSRRRHAFLNVLVD